MNRWFAVATMGASMGLACGGPTNPACDTFGGFVYVDVPGGARSVSAIEASGACVPDPTAMCATISQGCDGSACDCKFLFLIAEATFESDRICHLRATSSSGQVFTRDVTITTQDARCYQPISPFVVLEFQDGGASDGGASDARDAPVDADAPSEVSEATPARGP
jgi:hypothetical protein